MQRSLRWTLLGLALPSALAALVILVLSLSSFQSLDHSARQALVAKDVVADILPPPMYLIEMRLVLSQAMEHSLPVAEAQRRFDKLVDEYGQRADYWRSNPPHGLERYLLGRQHTEAERFIGLARVEVLRPLAAGDANAALSGLKRADVAYLAHRAAVDETVGAGSAFAERAIADFDTTRQRGYWLLPLAAAGLLALSGLFGVLIYRSLIVAVRQCTRVARQVAAGDLSQQVSSPRRDELGDLVRSMNEMSQNLARIVGGVRQGSQAIALATAEIAQGNLDLSARTESQAAHLQETAASVEQMSSTLAGNAGMARQADERVSDASRIASEGDAAVGTLVVTMGDIQASSPRIVDNCNDSVVLK